MIGAPGVRTASMPTRKERSLGPQLELNLADYSIQGASVGYGTEGSRFACTIEPVSDETMVALDRAAASHGTICLLLPKPLLLELVTFERRGPHRIRIVGRMFDAAKTVSE
jgi:hypothetical protein